MLQTINRVLHDLYYDAPQGLHGTKLEIVFTDRDHVVDPLLTYKFRLVIHDVMTLQSKGNIADTPGGEVELNELVFDSKKNTLFLRNVHPLQLSLSVKRLKVELDQLDPIDT